MSLVAQPLGLADIRFAPKMSCGHGLIGPPTALSCMSRQRERIPGAPVVTVEGTQVHSLLTTDCPAAHPDIGEVGRGKGGGRTRRLMRVEQKDGPRPSLRKSDQCFAKVAT